MPRIPNDGTSTTEIRIKALLYSVIRAQQKISSSKVDSQDLKRLIVKHAAEISGAQAVAYARIEGDQLFYEFRSDWEDPFNYRTHQGHSLASHALSERKPVICYDAELDPRVDAARCAKLGVRSMLVIPLYRDEVALGVVQATSPDPNFFDETTAYAVGMLSEFFSDSLIRVLQNEENIRLIADLKIAQLDLLEAKHQAEEANGAKSQFLAMMSHEIRTPLNGVLTTSELLATTALTSKQLGYVDTISVAGNLLRNIISDILDFSKIDAGLIQLENMDFDLRTLCYDVEKVVAPALRGPQVALNINLSGGDRWTLRGDAVRLKQILINILGNAVKFTDIGQVTLNVSTKTLGGSVQVNFEVSDTGIGMSEETLEKIFISFRQANSSISRNYGGTGLGVTIAKRLIELLGGELHVESRLGVGSKFTFRVNFDESDERFVIADTGPRISRVPREEPLRVLIVDDNELNRTVTTEVLEEIACECRAVASGTEALTALDQEPFDLVLLDWQMPALDGFEVAKRIRASTRKNLSSIVIIAYTANAFRGDRELCLKAGMNDYLCKPSSLDEIRRMIYKWDARIGIQTVDAQLDALEAFSATKLERKFGGSEGFSEGSSEGLHKILSLYLQSAGPHLKELDDCLKAGDAAKALKRLHAIRSSAGNVGAARVRWVATLLDNSLRRNPEKPRTELVSRLASEFEIVREQVLAIVR